ncbi:MAG TPA: sensor domain-containing diguanylate cyclase, partial [Dehalococcoidia bacterium]
EELRHRNNQLNALHNVFSEITETLSLDYVVRATLREAMKLTRADMTVLRLLRGSELAVVGAVTVGGRELTDLPSAPLGEGPNGRVAKTGRSIKFDSDAERMMSTRPLGHAGRSPSDQTGGPQMESGIIVPLIVRTHVVGTLAVYSHGEAAFSAEDQRFLEMMASQVATAIVAADTTDTSERRAHEDVLTGLPNRLQLSEDLAGDLANLYLQGRRAVVAMADIDHFKRFNDDYGHRVGDVTLGEVAGVLRSSVRENDRVYRFGGEEFVLIFLDVGPEEARSLAERVRDAIETRPFAGEHLEAVGPVTISIGLAALPDHDTNLNHLIELADKAMYQAKDAGRNKVVFWNENEGASIPSLVA